MTPQNSPYPLIHLCRKRAPIVRSIIAYQHPHFPSNHCIFFYLRGHILHQRLPGLKDATLELLPRANEMVRDLFIFRFRNNYSKGAWDVEAVARLRIRESCCVRCESDI